MWIILSKIRPVKKINLNDRSVFICFVLTYALLVWGLFGQGETKFENLHLLLDTSNGLLSLLLAFFLVAEQCCITNRTRIFLVIGFFAAASTEILHALIGIEWTGMLSWIATYSKSLRPATWPPSTYALPFALSWALWLKQRQSQLPTRWFVSGLLAVILVFYILALLLPKYVDTGILGIQRPTQVPLLFLWLLVIHQCWKIRHEHPLFEGLISMGVFLILSDLFMLYSTSPHEKFTMMAHSGKLFAYLWMHFILMRLAAQSNQSKLDADKAIFEQTQQLKILLDVEKNLHFALDQHSIFSITDVSGKITHVNDLFCDISGYSRDELLGQDHKMLNSGHHPRGFFKAMYLTIARGEIWTDEVCNRAKNGALHWTHTTVVPFRGSENKIEKYFEFRTDITQRKKLEYALREYNHDLEMLVEKKTEAIVQSEQLLHTVINTSLDAIIGMDDRGCITRWNKQAEIIFGWTFSEVNGQYLHEFLIPHRYREAHQKGLANYLATALDTMVGQRIELFALRRDGSEFPIELAITAISTSNGMTFSAFIVDMTERREVSKALLAGKLLAESGNRAKSEFLANMSHEIRTPMNGVVGMVDILNETELSVQQHGMLNIIRQSSLSLLNILNDILDYSKIEAGQLKVENVPTCLKEVVEEISQLMVAIARSKTVELSVVMSSSLPHFILTDPLRLRQILLNLLSNAIKFSSGNVLKSGKVLLRVEAVVTDGMPVIEFCVCDNGIGMSPGTLAMLFVPFSQADGSISRKYGGTGLGLSISSQLAGLMGGKITVDSMLDQGSEFKVELPLIEVIGDNVSPVKTHHPANVDSRKFAVEAVELNAKTLKSPLILLAEDNDTNRFVIKEQLRVLGYASEDAEDGVQAFAMWQRGNYALLLTDVNMPNMDGYQLSEAIRKAEPKGVRLPIIAVTANAMNGQAECCAQYGMDDYLSKPLRLGSLREKLARWLPLPEAAEDTELLQLRDTEIDSASDTLAIWDETQLTQLMGDNPGFQRRTLELFLSGAKETVSDIGTALLSGEMSRASALAHKLKSAARTVGAMSLGGVCQEIEAMASDENLQAVNKTEGCTKISLRLNQSFTGVAAVITKYLG